jgi:hypothetical protein
MFCKVEGCDNYCEGRTDQCASHNAMDRKLAKVAMKEKKVYLIPKVSNKMAVDLRLYYKKREAHLKKHPSCQIKLIGCTGKATTVHHSAKRGKNLTNEETFMSGCGHCHHLVETKLSAKERREKGFLK